MLEYDYNEPLPKVEVKKAAAGTGYGLFAGEKIAADHLIIEYTGDRIDSAEADRRGGEYLFQVTDDLTIDGSDEKNIGRYINHACKPNAEAEHEVTEDRVYIRAVRDIAAGEEITFDYGQEYFKRLIAPHGCRCPDCRKQNKSTT